MTASEVFGLSVETWLNPCGEWGVGKLMMALSGRFQKVCSAIDALDFH
jgi:hypothetical protein